MNQIFITIRWYFDVLNNSLLKKFVIKFPMEIGTFEANTLNLNRFLNLRLSGCAVCVCVAFEMFFEEVQWEMSSRQNAIHLKINVVFIIKFPRNYFFNTNCVLCKLYKKSLNFNLKDVLKPVLRKDWNCPWVKRDGKGLKNVVRNYFGTDPVPAPIKTSHTHFYR